MPLTGSPQMSAVIDTTLDANTLDAVTPDTICMEGCSVFTLFVAADGAGTHATHQVTLEVSPDGSDWFQTSHAITGLGMVTATLTGSEARAKTTIVEGSPSSVKVTIWGA